MKLGYEIWNERYKSSDYIYGEKPNSFFKNFIDNEKPGKILLPAEGEGRNSVYAAQKGWECFAFDFSIIAREKALHLAKKNNVNIIYDLSTYEDMRVKPAFYDSSALIFSHLQPNLRLKVHGKIIESVIPGGKIIIQAFSKKQIDYNSGGPKDIELLYSMDELADDFKGTEIISLIEKEVLLNEGSYHEGDAWVLEMIARKRSNGG